MFWFALLAFVAFTVVGELLRPRLQKEAPQPSGIGDFQVPTADATRPIPIAFGTVLSRGGNVTWYGDLFVRPITKKVRTGLFSSERITIGYRYWLGMQMALCHGVVDVFRGVRFGDKMPTITTSTVGDKLRIDMGTSGVTLSGGVYQQNPNRNLFGGDEREGGVAGLIDFHYGTASQAQNDYLQSKLGTNIPAWRQLCYAVFRQCYLGTSPYIKNIAFEFSRYPNQLGLGSGKHIVATYDANPACALYEILTNTVWGCRIPSGNIDLASFQAAGDALHAESMGISLIADSSQTGEQLLAEVQRHIDGVIYTDVTTGLVKIVLARKDYTPAALPVLDDSVVLDVELSRPSWSELVNTVQVSYLSRADNYTPRIAQQMNLAAVQIMGEKRSEDIPFLCFSRAEPANLGAARALKTLSYPLGRLKVRCNRKAYNYPPGKVFKLTWPPLGISEMICRVSHPEYGDLEAGTVTLQAVEDIFGIGSTAFTAPGGSSWVDPVTAPAAPTAQRLIEAPYQLVGAPDRHVLALLVRSSGADVGFEVWSDRAGGTTYAQTNIADAFCASGTLTGSYAASTAALDTTGFIIGAPVDASGLETVTVEEFEGGVNLLLVDDEIMAFRTVTDNGDGTWTISNVLRGVLDTVPAAHSTSARVYFIMPPGAALLDPLNPYGADGTITAKCLPFNSRGILPIASATQLTITTASRALKPLPPGNVKVNAVAWPTSVVGGVDIPVTWAHRHRTLQATDLKVVAQDAGDYTATPEGTYTVEIRVGGVLKRNPSVSGTTFTWTIAMQIVDAATIGSTVSIRVVPVNGSLVGTYQERTFTIA